MPIPSGYAAECCVCQRYFTTKAELDAHSRLFEAEHAAALSKGTRIDFGKSFELPLEFNRVIGTGQDPHSIEREMRDVAAQRAAIAQSNPLDGIFDQDAKHAHVMGNAAPPVGSEPLSGIDPQFAHLVHTGRW